MAKTEKIDSKDQKTEKVTKRGDGKVLKPEGWKAPELKPFLSEFK